MDRVLSALSNVSLLDSTGPGRLMPVYCGQGYRKKGGIMIQVREVTLIQGVGDKKNRNAMYTGSSQEVLMRIYGI